MAPERPIDRSGFEIAIVCALPLEATAIQDVLDHVYKGDESFGKDPDDENSYTCGTIGEHNVVLAHMPDMGEISAATVASSMKLSFKKIHLAIIAGICGGVPRPVDSAPIFLGDLIVSNLVVQYDFGRLYPAGFQRKDRLADALGRQGPQIRGFLSMLSTSIHYEDLSGFLVAALKAAHTRRPEVTDVIRRTRTDPETSTTLGSHVPRIHFGTMGSGNTVMKSGIDRDNAARDHGFIAMEMEGAGAWDSFPSCLIVKGVCDYADSHKQKGWQQYAAAVAAAGIKALLQQWYLSKTSLVTVQDNKPFANEHWMVRRTSNHLFTGRRTILGKIETALSKRLEKKSPSKPCCIVITGMGGQGKSEVCLRIANKMRHRFWGVFWIEVNNEAQAQAGFVALSERIGRPASDIDGALDALNSAPGPFLLILDNADDIEKNYSRYFPSASNGAVLLSSRNPDCAEHATKHQHFVLDRLHPPDDEELLRNTIGIKTGEQNEQAKALKAVCELVDGHPLAVIQAGTYIRQGFCVLKDYPEQFQRQSSRLLKHHLIQSAPRYGDVYSTFEVAAQLLKDSQKQHDQDALELLSTLAMLHWSPLPCLSLFNTAWKQAHHLSDSGPDDVSELSPWHLAQLSTWLPVVPRKPSYPSNTGPSEPAKEGITRSASNQLDANIWSAMWEDPPDYDNHRLVEAANKLNLLGLISLSRTGEDVLISMHPLAHAWAKERQSTDEQTASLTRAACLLLVSATNLGYWRSRAQILQPHILKLTEPLITDLITTQPRQEVLKLIWSCFRILSELRLDTQHLKFLEDAFFALELNPETPKEKHWQLYYAYGYSLDINLCYTQAINVLTRVTQVMLAGGMSHEHADVVMVKQMLSDAYYHDGQAMEAAAILEPLLQAEQKSSDSSYTLLSLEQRLGNAYTKLEKYKKAVDLLLHAVSRQQEKRSATHPDLLGARYDLGLAYFHDDQIVQAIHHFKYVVETRRNTLADNHPSRLDGETMLAMAYLHDEDESRHSEAIELLERVKDITENTFGDLHPLRLKSKTELAKAYLKVGQLQDALTLIQSVVQAQSQLPEKDLRRLNGEHICAKILWKNGRRVEAERMLTRVVDADGDSSSDENVDRQNSRNLLHRFRTDLRREAERTQADRSRRGSSNAGIEDDAVSALGEEDGARSLTLVKRRGGASSVSQANISTATTRVQSIASGSAADSRRTSSWRRFTSWLDEQFTAAQIETSTRAT
ncbi:Hypothetical protein D9617_22g066310 [Elsinoe fawcettii]|nr:Hypothetical protein D9617_22g066310 [Elsinoe fawcettii]